MFFYAVAWHRMRVDLRFSEQPEKRQRLFHFKFSRFSMGNQDSLIGNQDSSQEEIRILALKTDLAVPGRERRRQSFLRRVKKRRSANHAGD